VNEATVGYDGPETDAQVRPLLVARLHQEVAAMNVDNFVVRPRRRVVEKFAKIESWTKLEPDGIRELARNVAGLPSELDPENEETKRFDLLVLELQLALLRDESSYERLRERVVSIAGLLEERSAIPMVRERLLLIQEVQTDEWWEDVTVAMLERVRLRLRDLVKLIEKGKREPIYTDFEDEHGVGTDVALLDLGGSGDFAKFQAKAQAYLRAHQDHIAIHKLRMNKPLSAADLDELERMLVESGIGAPEEFDRAKKESDGLGLFVRSLVGLDRSAAKAALGEFLEGKALRGNQIQFIDLIVNHLTEHGSMEPSRLYESPFTDLTPHGPDGLFTPNEVEELMRVLEIVRRRAAA
jgi:type I restriction enzyme R subunit